MQVIVRIIYLYLHSLRKPDRVRGPKKYSVNAGINYIKAYLKSMTKSAKDAIIYNNKQILLTNNTLYNILTKHNITFHTKGHNYEYECCGTFIIPGHRIQWYPKEFYKDMLIFMLNSTYDQYYTTRYAYEYLVYALYADIYGSEIDPGYAKEWYIRANHIITRPNKQYSSTIHKKNRLIYSRTHNNHTHNNHSKGHNSDPSAGRRSPATDEEGWNDTMNVGYRNCLKDEEYILH